jgi:hypothetical protein
MNIKDLKVGDFVSYTSTRGDFDGPCTRYGRVVEIRNGEALCSFGRLTMMRLTDDDEDSDIIRRVSADEARALLLI